MDYHLFTPDKPACAKCGVRKLDFMWSSGPFASCSGVNIFSCCGPNGKGSSRWDSQAQAWKCSDCGNTTSTDANYVSGKIESTPLPWWAKDLPKCTCGAEKVHGADTGHSTWCDKYRKY